MKHKEIIRFSVFIFVLAIATYFFMSPVSESLRSPQILHEKISSYGNLAPFLFIVFGVIEIVIAVIPGQAVNLAGGYIFGALFGSIYSIISSVIGLFIVFSITKRFGRPFVERVVNKKYLQKFDYITHKQGVIPLFLVFFIPVFPSDAIAYLAGLTGLRLRTLLSIAVLARLPGTIIFTCIGAGIGLNNPFIILLLAVIVIFSAILYFKRETLIRRMKNVH
jgi:uncharacterized membrane protein YdjX (TVP38/TMEM64 family)